MVVISHYTLARDVDSAYRRCPVKTSYLPVHGHFFVRRIRAKRTAGYLHVSDVIFIVTYTSALKIKAHGRRSALKTKPRDSVWSFRTSVYFYVTQSSNADKFKVVGCYDHNLNTDRKRRLFNFGKGTQAPKEGI